jgi:tetrahydromethanopterin S-methyltransferase subunit A
VAVCTLASRRLLPLLAGRPEIAVAGRVFTENIGVERMIQNLVAMTNIRYLILCGHESAHRVGQTILALHRQGLDPSLRVIGSEAPEPILPNLTADQLATFQRHVTLVDMIGEDDAEAVVARAAELAAQPAPSDGGPAHAAAPASAVILAEASPTDAWEFDPAGYFVVLVNRPEQKLRAEQYSHDHRLLRVFEGRTAEALAHTIVREGQVTVLAHAAYLGRELAKAESALRLGLDYEQDVSLRAGGATPEAT